MSAKLRIHLTENLGYVPPLLGYLASIDQFTDGYRRHRVRHPGGIFNLQLGDFASNLLDLVKAVTSEESLTPLVDNKDLLKKLSATLFAFTNYYNAAYDIILGCCKPEHSSPSIDVWKWLKEHGYAAEAAYRSNLSEATFFLRIFNELKHSSKRFGTVLFTGPRDKVLGYYLECVDESGAIIPAPEYHANHRGQRTANSFNYDLRRLYYLLYKIADVLATAMQQHFQDVYSVMLPFDSMLKQDGTLLVDLFQTVHILPLVSLPNEKGKSVPVSRIVGRGQHEFLVFDNYREQKSVGQSAIYEVSALLPQADGFSRSWGLPYYGKPQSDGH